MKSHGGFEQTLSFPVESHTCRVSIPMQGLSL